MNVHIVLHARERFEGEETVTSLTADGTLHTDGDTLTLSYTERQEDAPPAETTLTVSPAFAVIRRTAEVTSELVLKKGERNLCRYQTPFGALSIGVFTDEIDVSVSSLFGGHIRLAYTLFVAGSGKTQHEMTLHIQPQ